jgi:hypothetical protein
MYVWPIQKDTQFIKLALSKMPELLTLIKYQSKQAFRNSSEDKFIKYHHYKSATKVLYYGKMSLNLIFSIKRNMFCLFL